MNQVKLSYQEFLEVVLQEMKTRFGEEYYVQLNSIQKNNSITMDGIIILQNGKKMTPNIYLEPYYIEYEDGQSLSNVVEDIISEYNNKIRDKEDLNLKFTFENMKDCIIYRVINRERNRELLRECPYIEFLDLAATFHCLVQDQGESIGTIRITNEHLKLWNVELGQILRCAQKNTMNLMPPLLRKMEDVLKELLTSETNGFELDHIEFERNQVELEEVFAEDQDPMYILTNVAGIHGASSLLYEDTIRNLSKLLRCDLYILPSSIHEVLLLPAYHTYDVDQLENMVTQINRDQVLEEEVLSNHIYYYSYNHNKLSML